MCTSYAGMVTHFKTWSWPKRAVASMPLTPIKSWVKTSAHLLASSDLAWDSGASRGLAPPRMICCKPVEEVGSYHKATSGKAARKSGSLTKRLVSLPFDICSVPSAEFRLISHQLCSDRASGRGKTRSLRSEVLILSGLVRVQFHRLY